MAFENEESKRVAEIQKNNRGDFVIVSEIKNKATGSVSVDIRQFYTNDAEEVAPTKKGLRINSEILPEVVKGLLQILQVDELEDMKAEIDSLLDDSDADEEAEEATEE